MLYSTMIIAVISTLIGVSAAATEELACGAISLTQFKSMFAAGNLTNSLVQDNFDALVAACDYAHIERLDNNQASFLLGSIAFNTANLTSHVSQEERLGGNSTLGLFAPRGAMMLAGKAQYELFQAWTASLLVSFDVVANPEKVGSSLIVSYISAMYVMSTIQANGKSCLQMTSAGEVGTCIAMINPWECSHPTEQSNRLSMIQLASCVMGQRYSDVMIESFRCSPVPTLVCPQGNATVAPLPSVPCPCMQTADSDLDAVAAAVAAANNNSSNGTLLVAATDLSANATNATAVNALIAAQATMSPSANCTALSSTAAETLAKAASAAAALIDPEVSETYTPRPTSACNCTEQDLIDVLTSASSRSSSWPTAIAACIVLVSAFVLV